jgi:hypothetical protein
MKKNLCIILLATFFGITFADPQESGTDYQESLTAPQEIVTEPEAPAADYQEPITIPQEIVTEPEAPAVDRQEPVTAPREIVTEPEAPAADRQEPLTVPREIVTEPEAPAADHQEPLGAPQKIVADSQESPEDGGQPFSVTLDAVFDAVYIRTLSGDYAEKNPALSGSPYKYQGDGDISSFRSSVFDDGLNARVKFDYSNEVFGGILQLKAESGTAVLGDWEAWLRPGKHLRILTGNTGQRGQVEQYKHFDDFLKTRVDYFGVLYPVWKLNPRSITANNFDTMAEFPYGYDAPSANYGYAELAGTDTNDLFMPAGSTSRQTMGVLLDLSYAPVTLSASVGGLFQSQSRPAKKPWSFIGNTVSSEYDSIYDPAVNSGTNFAFRLEGAKILDMVTAAAVYKYADSYLEKLTAPSKENTIDEKIKNHAFGLYVNVTPPVSGLGISVGYSGLLKTLENPKYNDTDTTTDVVDDDLHLAQLYRETLFPFYNGIDLRVVYRGIENLTLTCNNNISFATVYGTTNRDEVFASGWAYSGKLNEADDGNPSTPYRVPFRSENYTGLYNSLGVNYRISESLAADLQVANRRAFFTLQWEEDPLGSVTNSFGVYAGAVYTVYRKGNFHASIRGGLDLKWNTYSYQDDSTLKNVHHAGYMDFGIPVAIKVIF